MWVSNALGLALGAGILLLAATAAIWRVAAWNAGPAAMLIHDEGLPLGSLAPGVAGHRGDGDVDLAFLGGYTFVVFGGENCEPCADLVEIAPVHPATRWMRLVYLSATDHAPGRSGLANRWETYRLDNEVAAREQWRAPVIPYYHVVDERGRVRAKGVANKDAHLDRLFSILPLRPAEQEVALIGGGVA